MSKKRQIEFILRVRNIRIGDKKSDPTHSDEFTSSLHALANTKIVAKQINPTWFESKNYFLHKDWVEVIRKN